MSPNRRRFLHAVGITGASSFTGCLFSPGGCVYSASFDMTKATTGRIANAYATSFSGLGPLDTQLATAAVEGESPTITTIETQPDLALRSGPVQIDGKFYQFSTTLESTSRRTGYEFTFEASEEVATAATPDQSIAFEELPVVDQRVLLHAFLNLVFQKTRNTKIEAGSVSFEETKTLVYPDSAAEADSALVPNPDFEYITDGELTVSVTKEGTKSNVTARTFAIHAETIASSTDAFVESMKEAHGISLQEQSLSSAQTDILETAIDQEYGYNQCLDETKHPEFEPLMGRIFDFDGDLREAYSDNPRLVEYEGSLYLATYSVAVA